MTCADATRITMLFLEGLLDVEISLGDPDSSVLDIYSSVAVRNTDECIAPAYDYLHSRCFRVRKKIMVEDESVIQCKAWQIQYEVFTKCPGQSTEHDCREERNGDTVV